MAAVPSAYYVRAAPKTGERHLAVESEDHGLRGSKCSLNDIEGLQVIVGLFESRAHVVNLLHDHLHAPLLPGMIW